MHVNALQCTLRIHLHNNVTMLCIHTYMCDREDEEQLLHEWVEVGQEADPKLGTKRLYGIEDLCETSSAMRLLLLLLLELLYGRVHELEQHWHQLTMVFTNLWLQGKNGEGDNLLP